MISGHAKFALIKELALEGGPHIDMARSYGIKLPELERFAEQYAGDIARTREQILTGNTDAIPGLWIVDSQARQMEYQDIYERAKHVFIHDNSVGMGRLAASILRGQDEQQGVVPQRPAMQPETKQVAYLLEDPDEVEMR